MKHLLVKALENRLDEVRKKISGLDGSLSGFSSDATCDCDVFLRKMAANNRMELQNPQDSNLQPVHSFLEQLDQKRDQAVSLLKKRFNFPWIVSLDSEREAAEWLLCQLMVTHRPKAEKKRFDRLNMEEVLLELNLTAVKAISSRDLRFLDSLNFYYEQLPFLEMGIKDETWMYAAFLGIYSQALAERKSALEET